MTDEISELKATLKPCPFCGELPYSYEDYGVLMVSCQNSECVLWDLADMSADSWQHRSTQE